MDAFSLQPSPAADSLEDFLFRMSMVRGLEEIMEIVRLSARNLIGADGVTFVLRDGDKCHYADEDAISPLWKGQRFPIESCVSGWAMQNAEVVVIEDIYRDDRVPHAAYTPTFVKSLAMVPVRQEDPIGAIGAYWANPQRPSAESVRTLQRIANSAAVAMTNVALISSLAAAKEEAARARDAMILAMRPAIISDARSIMCGRWPRPCGTTGAMKNISATRGSIFSISRRRCMTLARSVFQTAFF
jgi:transcriptional regulator with GAF, ATPase, and Fis domain